MASEAGRLAPYRYLFRFFGAFSELYFRNHKRTPLPRTETRNLFQVHSLEIQSNCRVGGPTESIGRYECNEIR